MVTSMQSRYGYYQYDAAIQTLPDLAREAVKIIGWWDLHHLDAEAAEKRFKRVYEDLVKRQRDKIILPPELHQIMDQQRQALPSGC